MFNTHIRQTSVGRAKSESTFASIVQWTKINGRANGKYGVISLYGCISRDI